MSPADATKYFDEKSKKRDLSGNSNQGEGAKKLKEVSWNIRRASDIPDEVLTESLKTLGYVNILFSLIKIQKKQIAQIFENTKEMKEGQINDELQLAELMEALDFISNNFDDCEIARKEEKERIKTWKTA